MCHDSAVAPKEAAGAPGEIEITKEMLAAGEDVLLCELGGAVSSHWYPRELASAVYRSMAVLDKSRSQALSRSRAKR
jgi:hypothetical protein